MRDYAADMIAWMTDAVKRLPPNATIVAHQLVGELKARDPDLLDGWLRLQAEESLRRAVQRLVAPRRPQLSRAPTTPAHTAAHSFREAARALKAGDSQPLETILNRTYTIHGRTMTLASMTSEHLRTALQEFARSADRIRMEVAFLTALADRCEREHATVGDLYDETTLNAMWTSITAPTIRSNAARS